MKSQRKEITMENQKNEILTVKEKVSKKMGLAGYIHELYYQNAMKFMSDPRYSKLPSYLQTSGISSTFIALKEATDADRSRKMAEKLLEKSEDTQSLNKIA